MTWLDLLGAAAFTGSIGLCAGVLIGGRTRDVYEARDHARTTVTRLEQQLAQAQAHNLALRRHRWEHNSSHPTDNTHVIDLLVAPGTVPPSMNAEPPAAQPPKEPT